jgi:pyruvate kinase
LARYRPKAPIYAITHDDIYRRQLTLSWGVIPVFSVKNESLGMILSEVMKRGLEEGILDRQKRYILTAGDPTGITGSTNMIRLLSGEEMEFFKSLKEQIKK